MVVGGKGHFTTEVYQDNEWRIVSGILPRAMSSMEVTTFNDKILLFGNTYVYKRRLFFISKT